LVKDKAHYCDKVLLLNLSACWLNYPSHASLPLPHPLQHCTYCCKCAYNTSSRSTYITNIFNIQISRW
jgi:hypothetical protein